MAIEVLAIDGFTAGTLRLAGFFASGGGNGVALPTDLQVRALDVPGSAVQVVRGPSGGAALKSRYPSAGAQSYLTLTTETEQVPVPATDSSGGATRYIIQYVTDPQFEGQTPGARFACVDSLAGYAQVPHVVLARIDQPASTATIDQSMITDLRVMAKPNQLREMRTVYGTGEHTGGHPMATGSYSSWPITSAQRPELWVPEWATRLDVVAHFSGVLFEGDTETVAGIRSGFGTEGSENGIIIEDTYGRGHYTVVGTHAVEEARRGTYQLLNLQANRTRGTGMWYSDYQTSISIDYQFTAVPV